MRSSGRIVLRAALPLFLVLAACTEPVINVDEPEEVDSCEVLTIVGIELVNDYVYTMEGLDVAATRGDLTELPEELVILNQRGEELDRRIVELDCDAVAINRAVVEATEGIESDDPVVASFLETVRGGIVAPILPTYGDWQFDSGTIGDEELTPAPSDPITLTVERESVSGFAGCNGFFYPVELADGVWSWSDGTSSITDLSCDEDSDGDVDLMAIEQSFLTALEEVARYEIVDETLVLTGDGVELRFVRALEEGESDR